MWVLSVESEWAGFLQLNACVGRFGDLYVISFSMKVKFAKGVGYLAALDLKKSFIKVFQYRTYGAELLWILSEQMESKKQHAL